MLGLAALGKVLGVLVAWDTGSAPRLPHWALGALLLRGKGKLRTQGLPGNQMATPSSQLQQGSPVGVKFSVLGRGWRETGL